MDTNASGITVSPNGLDINGGSSGYTLNSANTITVVSDGANYWTSGANGANGTNGSNGSTGATGPTGSNGSNGSNGTNGANGCGAVGVETKSSGYTVLSGDN